MVLVSLPQNSMASMARRVFTRAIFRSRSVESQPRVQMQGDPGGRRVARSLHAHAGGRSLSSTRSPFRAVRFGEPVRRRALPLASPLVHGPLASSGMLAGMRVDRRSGDVHSRAMADGDPCGPVGTCAASETHNGSIPTPMTSSAARSRLRKHLDGAGWPASQNRQTGRTPGPPADRGRFGGSRAPPLRRCPPSLYIAPAPIHAACCVRTQAAGRT
jgi:hypothetical protein